MAKFSTSKKVAKILMYFGLSTILLSGIIFGISLLNVGANDLSHPDDPEWQKTSLFVNKTGSTTVIQMSDIPSGVITNPLSSDLIKFEEAYQCETISAPCYQLQGSAWDNPSIFNPQRPAWAYLLEAKKRAIDGYGRAGEGVGSDDTAYSLINNVIGQYVTASYSAWELVKWETNQITINSTDLINTAKGAQIPLANVNGEVTVSEPNSTVTMTLAESYTMASEDSLWLKSADFLLGSVFNQWEEAFRDYSVGISSISDNKTKLLSYISKYENSVLLRERGTESGVILSLDYPQSLDAVDNTANREFLGLNPANFALPAGEPAYNLKLYVKPYDKRNDQYHVVIQPSQSADLINGFKEFRFSWNDIKSKTYRGTAEDSTLPTTLASSPYYTFNFPQKYYAKLVLYAADNATKEDLTFEFDTINMAWTGPDAGQTDANGILSMHVKPSNGGENSKFDASIEVIKPTAAGAKIPEMVILYVCNNNAASVIEGDSEQCTHKRADGSIVDVIKTRWVPITYNEQNKAMLTYTWDTSGTAIGAHSLMAKAYSVDGSDTNTNRDYIDGSKTAVTVNVTNAQFAGVNDHNTDTRFSGLLAGLFKEKASAKPRGSSIVSFNQLIDKILLYSAGLIGLIAFFVILIAGIQYMTAGGNEAQTTKAKNAILYALLGIALYVLSYGIIFNVVHIIRDITGAGSGDSGAINLSTLLQGDPTGFDLDTAFRAAERLISIAVSFAAIVGFVMIIWASILYVTSVGDENKAETAKKTLIWSIAGTFIVSLAGFIVDLVDRFFA